VAEHLEIEQKYEADADFVVPALDGLPRVARVCSPVLYRLDATYYDTASLTLIGNKVTLRRRTGGPDEGWHLKLPVRGDTRRELHEPLGSATEVPLPLSSRVADLTADQPLSPIAILATERTVRRLFDDAGALLAEVADDQVTATRLGPDGSAAAAPLVWRELEVEAGEAGTPEFLAAAGGLLRDAGAHPARSASKLARVLA
jgi:inorganic triphosphatase YgiF